MTNCVFCRVLAGDIPATFRGGSLGCAVIVPIIPVVDGHVLVIPRTHVADFTEDLRITELVMRAAADYARGLDSDCNLITSKGPSATQTVMHMHVHVVPRQPGDGLLMPWGHEARL